ncbi:MAG: hypothetical protein V3U64_02945 [Cocleimonas sp.]
MGVCLSENICGAIVAEQLLAHSTEQHAVSVCIPQSMSFIASDIDDGTAENMPLDSSIISQTPIAETGVKNALNAKMSMNKRAIKISIRHF